MTVPGVSVAERLTRVAQGAGALLRENGFAWGPAVAVGSELTIPDALERVCTVPGDAVVLEQEYVRRINLAERAAGGPVLPDAYAPGAKSARIDFLSAIVITDEDLADHFGPAWGEVLARFGSIVAAPIEQVLDNMVAVVPVTTVERNEAWSVARNRARSDGREGQWYAGVDLVGLYFDSMLDEPNRRAATQRSTWPDAQTLSTDAVTAASLGDLADDTLARHLLVLSAPWRAVFGSDQARRDYAARHAGAVATDMPREDRVWEDYEDDYDPSIEDPVID